MQPDPDVFIIFPNPSHEKVLIRCPATIYKMSIFDVSGKEYFSETSKVNEVDVDLHSYDKGIYFLKIYTEAGIIIKTNVKLIYVL